ncbi:MAG: hypothetical protein CMF62_02395 [Magnetococcales bacterium]|nr:hypothetical protein [Magnetococcales bacterium]
MIEKEFICKKCCYKTLNKAHYDRHCLSKRHLKNYDIKIADKIHYNCTYCKYSTNRKDSYTRHMKRHLNDNSKEDMIDMLKNKDKQLMKIIKKMHEKDNQISELITKVTSSSKTINNNQNVYNYIVNNIKPSTNIDIEMERPLTEEEIAIIKNKPVIEGSYLYIHGRFIDGRKNSERLIVCCDLARNKFSYYNGDNKWVIDMKLKRFFEKVFEKIANVHTGSFEFEKDKNDVFEFIDEAGNRIKKYDNLKKVLKTNQTKLLHRLYDDIKIDKKFIDSHQDE